MDTNNQQTTDNQNIIQHPLNTKENTYLITIRPYDPAIDVWVTDKIYPRQRAYVIQAESALYGIQRTIFIEYSSTYTYIMNNFTRLLTDKKTHAREIDVFPNAHGLRIKFAVDDYGPVYYHDVDLKQLTKLEKEYENLREKYEALRLENAALKSTK
jgi:hypothetical protein